MITFEIEDDDSIYDTKPLPEIPESEESFDENNQGSDESNGQYDLLEFHLEPKLPPRKESKMKIPNLMIEPDEIGEFKPKIPPRIESIFGRHSMMNLPNNTGARAKGRTILNTNSQKTVL